jgi:hypothetical protein
MKKKLFGTHLVPKLIDKMMVLLVSTVKDLLHQNKNCKRLYSRITLSEKSMVSTPASDVNVSV